MSAIFARLFSRRTKKKAPDSLGPVGGGVTIRISSSATARPGRLPSDSLKPGPNNLQPQEEAPAGETKVAARGVSASAPGSSAVKGMPSEVARSDLAVPNSLREENPMPVSAESQIPLGRQSGPAERTILSSRRVALAEAHDYLSKVQDKINKLAEEFASGSVNRLQFQELYAHYQREKQAVETWMENAAGSEDWHAAGLEGRSILIRRQHTAHVLGYAIYENESGMPLRTIGKFEMDPEMFVPMLSSYRSATKEIFGGGMRSTQIEGGQWLCFVAGDFTTLMALFSNEPAGKQLQTLEEVHRLFERANRYLLRRQPVDAEALVLPHMFYLEAAH
ncbi:MAG: hypothetical protein ABSG98_10445 [Anaerolineales bacterium]